MGYSVEVYRGISFAANTVYKGHQIQHALADELATGQHARIGETLLGKELGNSGLATLKACLGLSIA
jgi:hypothetical protein